MSLCCQLYHGRLKHKDVEKYQKVKGTVRDCHTAVESVKLLLKAELACWTAVCWTHLGTYSYHNSYPSDNMGYVDTVTRSVEAPLENMAGIN